MATGGKRLEDGRLRIEGPRATIGELLQLELLLLFEENYLRDLDGGNDRES
jgi:hypothetical protein